MKGGVSFVGHPDAKANNVNTSYYDENNPQESTIIYTDAANLYGNDFMPTFLFSKLFRILYESTVTNR